MEVKIFQDRLITKTSVLNIDNLKIILLLSILNSVHRIDGQNDFCACAKHFLSLRINSSKITSLVNLKVLERHLKILRARIKIY
jgi:hypothetical protein